MFSRFMAAACGMHAKASPWIVYAHAVVEHVIPEHARQRRQHPCEHPHTQSRAHEMHGALLTCSARDPTETFAVDFKTALNPRSGCSTSSARLVHACPPAASGQPRRCPNSKSFKDSRHGCRTRAATGHPQPDDGRGCGRQGCAMPQPAQREELKHGWSRAASHTV